MDIDFADDELKEWANNSKRAQKNLGTEMAKKFRARLDDLHAAGTLEDLRNAPGRLHELKGDRKFQLSLDLKHPMRLVFVPQDVEGAKKGDGGLDWKKIRAIRILEIVDTHD